jgi:hypothetical protein
MPLSQIQRFVTWSLDRHVPRLESRGIRSGILADAPVHRARRGVRLGRIRPDQRSYYGSELARPRLTSAPISHARRQIS